MTCVQCNEKEQMTDDVLCSTCSSDNYFREMSFTQELPEIKYCNNCHQLEHDQVTDCPAFDYDFGVLNGVLTLAQFRKFTEHLSGHYQIVISDLDRNFLNVNLVSLPDDDETHVINLLTANTFDPRQI